ncbi:hypothetical protein IRT38_00720 (plasmid) [Acinetobacter sp. SK-43]|uniref:hypothetical protein n=1 Tax=Pseudomonadota TaxID=1224 RepID=UPI0012CEADCE|nr:MULTISPECIES: hypothetical protein [Pseudomonadota]MBF4453938.1 hypothetical protein [Acinetobacter sp. SK-43]MPS92869.1 hypothetical protein [Comamonas sp.]
MSDINELKNILNCNVVEPEGFKPKNDEQDIEKMRSLFNTFDELDYKFNKYDEKTIESIQRNRDHNTAYFYEYHRVPQNGEMHSTLARWRYQNDEVYKRFMFWRFLQN